MSPTEPTQFTIFTSNGETHSLEKQTGLCHRLATTANRLQRSGPIFLLPLVDLPAQFVKSQGIADSKGRVPLEKLMDPATLRVRPQYAEALRLDFDEPTLDTCLSRSVVRSYLRLAEQEPQA